jgi:hypothetical protein
MNAERARELLDYDPATGLLTWKISHGAARKGKVAGSLRKTGYRSVVMDDKNYYTHRVCWLMTYGAWPEHTINHINGDKSDNRIENLEDIHTGQNSRHAHRTGLICNSGERNGGAKLTLEQVLAIRASSLTCRELSQAYGVSENAVWKIVNNQSWRSVLPVQGTAAITATYEP